MHINELLQVADRIDSLIRRSDTFGKSKEDIIDELMFLSEDLRSQADRLEAQMLASVSETDLWYDTSRELE